MERSKSIFFFIIFLVIIAITIAFSKALPSKNEKNQETEDFIDTEEELDANSSPQDIETGFIEEPPIMLDETTARHLSNFRYKAGKLAKDYPDTFFTSLPTKERVVALTFDDGPDNVATPKVLDILNRYDITATFFFIGENIERHPDICEKVIASGHQIANHSFSHARPTDLSIGDMIDEFEKSNTILHRYIDNGMKFLRPPYGLVTESQLMSLRERGFKIIGWSIDSMDWYIEDEDAIRKCVIDRIHPGAIVLMHSAGGSDNREATIEALPIIIETLKGQNYTFVTIDDIITQ